MDFIKEPMAIENRSMELIAPHLAERGLDEAATKVYSRLIHASGASRGDRGCDGRTAQGGAHLYGR